MDDHRQAISDALEESFATIDSSSVSGAGPTLEYSEIRNTDRHRRSEKIRNPSIESGPETATLEFGPETCSSSDEESGGKIQKFSQNNKQHPNNINNHSHVQVTCDNVPNQSTNFAIENHQKPKISVNSNIENSSVPQGEPFSCRIFFPEMEYNNFEKIRETIIHLL